MADLEPALTVGCPTCFVKPGEPCRSRHAVSLHQSRRQALADLGVQADQLLALSQPERPRKGSASRPVPVLAGVTGSPVPDDGCDTPAWEPCTDSAHNHPILTPTGG